jgi:hypothetical protein
VTLKVWSHWHQFRRLAVEESHAGWPSTRGQISQGGSTGDSYTVFGDVSLEEGITMLGMLVVIKNVISQMFNLFLDQSF